MKNYKLWVSYLKVFLFSKSEGGGSRFSSILPWELSNSRAHQKTGFIPIEQLFISKISLRSNFFLTFEYLSSQGIFFRESFKNVLDWQPRHVSVQYATRKEAPENMSEFTMILIFPWAIWTALLPLQNDSCNQKLFSRCWKSPPLPLLWRTIPHPPRASLPPLQSFHIQSSLRWLCLKKPRNWRENGKQ